VLRIATADDAQQALHNEQLDAEAFVICQRKIEEHKLEMKLVNVEQTFDNAKILFYFTANGRVDFRALVKDLAAVFRTRIELRQIGVRDEAKMMGGLGPCGRSICCGSFLGDFQPVSIKMAKEQNLSLNPTKISGVCGRLMCCLKYEQDHYEQTRKRMPRLGRDVETPEGGGMVIDVNVLKEQVTVRVRKGDSSEVKTFALEDVKWSRPAQHVYAPGEQDLRGRGIRGSHTANQMDDTLEDEFFDDAEDKQNEDGDEESGMDLVGIEDEIQSEHDHDWRRAVEQALKKAKRGEG